MPDPVEDDPFDEEPLLGAVKEELCTLLLELGSELVESSALVPRSWELVVVPEVELLMGKVLVEVPDGVEPGSCFPFMVQ